MLSSSLTWFGRSGHNGTRSVSNSRPKLFITCLNYVRIGFYNQVSSNVQPRSAERKRCSWKPPSSTELVKTNFDGVVFSNTNQSGVGVVIRDAHGLVIASYARKLPKAYRAVEVESLAAAMALSFALDIGISCAVLEGDSWEVFKALTDDKPALTSYGLLVNDAEVISRNINGNSVIYSLTKYAINIPN